MEMMKKACKPGKIQDPELLKLMMWRKEDGNSGSRGGEKEQNQLQVKADYQGRVLELHLVDIAKQSYSWHAFKSKVNKKNGCLFCDFKITE